MNVIADIAGQRETLDALIKKMPKDMNLSVGDMNDRGPDTKGVFDFFMQPDNYGMFGNHEHLMLDFLLEGKQYDYGLWIVCNGGWETIKSFMDPNEKYCCPEMIRIEQLSHMYFQGQYISDSEMMSIHYPIREFFLSILDKKYIEWLQKLPAWIENNTHIITHAPINPTLTKKRLLDFKDTHNLHYNSVLWNRGGVRRRKDKMQLYGHMARNQPFFHKDKEGTFAIGLDTSKARILTGYSTITKEIYQQEYV